MTEGSDLMTSGVYSDALDNFVRAVDQAETARDRLTANERAGDILANYLDNSDSASIYFNAAMDDADVLSSEELRNLTKNALSAFAAKAAVRGYNLWLEKYSEDPLALMVRYELAEVYHKNIRDLNSAIEQYKIIYETYPDSEQAPKALFSIAYIYANEIGDTESAKNYYTRFIDQYPDHEMAPSVQFELKYLGKDLEEIPELKHLLSKTS